jgi:hypothetical protein
MPAKIKKSFNYNEVKKRIKKIPQVAPFVISGMLKKDAIKFISMFHKGIKSNSLGLYELAEATKKAKENLGYLKPETPMYGKGDQNKKKSYVNMLRIRRLKNGWKVFPSWGKHHKANMILRELLKKHETGFTIKKGDTVTRIPPRPAFLITKNNFLTGFKQEQKNKKISREINKYIKTGKSEWFDAMVKSFYAESNDLLE